MGKMVNTWHVNRQKDLIASSGGKVVLGGETDESRKYVAPTIIDNPKLDSPVMNEEIFGPVLPILTFKNIDDIIQKINDMPKPLAIYYFGKRYFNPNIEKLEK